MEVETSGWVDRAAPFGRRLFAAALLACCAGAARAEQTASVEPSPELSRAEFERVSREIADSAGRRGALESEIARIKKDHASIAAALIQSAKTERKLSEDIDDISRRLSELEGKQALVRESLATRRDVLAEVLGALQRMGLNPPPAILVKPEDALASVRSAILLGAVVPELRQQSGALLADLDELRRLAAGIAAERERLAAAVAGQAAERERLSLLLAEKQRLRTESETALAAERKRSEELAARAGSLKELIAGLETQAAQAEIRRRAEAEARRRAEADKARRHAEIAVLPVPEANRLAAMPFSALKGQVALPAIGRIKRRFGGKDGNGGVMLGDTLATQSAATVTAPSDGSVLYAGPFRSYGQLLILDAGDGYHVVLAGMSRINVGQGQAVLAGEPVGTMGEARVASASAEPHGNAAPELYIEFRKDGKPVDPTPWWSDRLSGRTGNGT